MTNKKKEFFKKLSKKQNLKCLTYFSKTTKNSPH